MTKIILALTILLLTSSCMFFGGSEMPYFSFLRSKVPYGTPLFQIGFKGGCETAMYSRGNVFYRTFHKGQKYKPEFIDNPEYRFGFSRGYSYCFNQLVQGAYIGTVGGERGGWDAYLYGRQVPMDMGSGNIDNTVNYGPLNWMNIPDGGLNGVVDDTQKGQGGGVFSSHPLWGTWQTKQIFGQ